jgi:hypothetical protein
MIRYLRGGGQEHVRLSMRPTPQVCKYSVQAFATVKLGRVRHFKQKFYPKVNSEMTLLKRVAKDRGREIQRLVSTAGAGNQPGMVAET